MPETEPTELEELEIPYLLHAALTKLADARIAELSVDGDSGDSELILTVRRNDGTTRDLVISSRDIRELEPDEEGES